MKTAKKTQFEDIRFHLRLIRQEELRKLTGFKSQGFISQLLNKKRSNPNSKRSKKETRTILRNAIVEYHKMYGIPIEYVPMKYSD